MEPTLFTNARFWTLNPEQPDSPALLARGGRIEALGEAALAAGAGARRIDLGGRVAIPGPVDAHCHLVSYGLQSRREADLRGARSLAEIESRLREHAVSLNLRPGDGRWLLGRGFEQDLLAEARWPTREDLDRIAPGIPARLTRVCGHAIVANTLALKAAGLDPAAPHGAFPPGVLTESSIAPVYAAIPAPTAEEWLAAARWACREAARVGFVGVHSLMAHAKEVRALLDLRAEGPLPVRVCMQLPYALLESAAAAGFRTGFGDEYLEIGAVKLFSDGSLGARTAALDEPYSDDPSTTGELIFEPSELARRTREVYRAGFQVCIHAIGDRAMQVTLDAIRAAEQEERGRGRVPAERVAEERKPPARIEHASMVNARLLREMRELGVGAAIQPQFARSDYWAPERLGEERAKGCYAFRTLWEAGIPLAGSTDCPVEKLDALAAIGQLVDRPAWSPDEGLPVDVTLRIFSEGSYALRGFPPGSGRLAPGEFADFVVLEEDPRTVPPSEIERIPVAMTVVSGDVSYARS